MSLLNQKTIKNSVSFSVIGLHSGKPAKICVKPSSPDTGIVFKRIDLKDNNLIYPNFMNVSNTALNTTISNSNGVKVSTIEHLMGALFGIGIDNVLVEIDNEEVPILDGSAKQFIEKILSVGLISSDKPIKIIKINKKIEFRNKDKFISIEPSKLSLDIDFQIKYQNKIIHIVGTCIIGLCTLWVIAAYQIGKEIDAKIKPSKKALPHKDIHRQSNNTLKPQNASV